MKHDHGLFYLHVPSLLRAQRYYQLILTAFPLLLAGLILASCGTAGDDSGDDSSDLSAWQKPSDADAIAEAAALNAPECVDVLSKISGWECTDCNSQSTAGIVTPSQAFMATHTIPTECVRDTSFLAAADGCYAAACYGVQYNAAYYSGCLLDASYYSQKVTEWLNIAIQNFHNVENLCDSANLHPGGRDCATNYLGGCP